MSTKPLKRIVGVDV